MTAAIIVFWILMGVLAFGLALALQMRLMIGVVLARALRAVFKDLTIPRSRLAVVAAGNRILAETAEPDLQGPITHLYATYEKPLSHLALARRVSRWTPPLLVLMAALWRFGFLGG